MRLMRMLVALTIVGVLIFATGLVPSRVLAVDAVVSGDDCNWAGLVTAINTAKSTTDSGGTVTFDCAEPNTTITFTSEIVIDANVTIDGRNGDGPSIIFDGVQDDDIATKFLQVSSGAELSLNQLTLRNADDSAISNSGSLNITNVSFIENDGGYGGAISNDGTMTVDQTLFLGNQATIGGAIYLDGPTTITRSSFIDNYGDNIGGAVYARWGTSEAPASVQIASSTFSGNTAGQNGSGIFVEQRFFESSFSLAWSTFVQPAGENAVSLYVAHPLYVSVRGVSFGGLGLYHCQFANGMPAITNSLSNDSSCDGDTNINGAWENQNLQLDDQAHSLVNGTTQYYYSLLDGSPALNSGGTDCETPDQIGTPRPYPSDGQCDIGAFEFVSNPPDITSINAPASANEGEDVAVSVTATDTEGDTLHYWIDCESDGTWELTDSTTSSTTCNYQDNGDFTITVQVSDGSVTVSDTKDVSVANVNPIITQFTASLEVAQFGQPVMLSVEATDVSGDLPLTVTYSCDGVETVSTNCAFNTGGMHTVSVTVDDGDGGTDSAAKIITVNSPPGSPVISISDPALEGPGGATVTVTTSDPDGDTLYYSIKCDIQSDWDLEGSTNNSVECNYPDEGTYSVSILVTDGMSSATGGMTVDILNAAPVITDLIANPNPAIVGVPVVLSTTWTDVSADVPNVTLTYDCGNGTLVSPDTCSFSSFGSQQVSVTADDHDGGVTTQFLEVQVIQPISLCVDRWTGQLREASGSDCGSGETLIELPQDATLNLCVNQWNGAARVSTNCSRSEYVLVVDGDPPVSFCINRWNGAMRVSSSCSRSERQEWI